MFQSVGGKALPLCSLALPGASIYTAARASNLPCFESIFHLRRFWAFSATAKSASTASRLIPSHRRPLHHNRVLPRNPGPRTCIHTLPTWFCSRFPNRQRSRYYSINFFFVFFSFLSLLKPFNKQLLSSSSWCPLYFGPYRSTCVSGWIAVSMWWWH